ncbi:hypothetical protein CEUSTIGMA_g3923.t1 [Chlamydomonas eustigma]|uniref:leucine--tRNA ligase n=1 Tax=Chlamydomonas eustigma TaxID=1157962 RepID=A0A250X078_9CHLO|nr:hypothetical protein CEUSTIGMA_g3923.t1 [Chlamydomonas eustigma]|eukprot:GAX76478.1 hypothetical protein CEUSTIGMA_g3923.t1 [Chlamydomonas eustigma]
MCYLAVPTPPMKIKRTDTTHACKQCYRHVFTSIYTQRPFVTLRTSSSRRVSSKITSQCRLRGQVKLHATAVPSVTTSDVEVSNESNEADSRQSTAYPFPDIEAKWQAYWLQHKTFRTPEEIDTSKPKYYVLDMFPYPSGSGLHVGHPEGYTATDIMARYKRMRGFNVLHPMGWDAFGLPAEQYAIQTGTHPRVTTERNVNRFRQQLQMLGFSYDWDRELSTTDPSYFKWTQWIFTKLFEKGLAYQAEVPVNWCPALGTVLANEEVIDGKSERGGYPVVRMPMKQWMLKITAFADRLLDDLEGLDWSDSIKEMQRNWIGRSEGADVTFGIQAGPGSSLSSEAAASGLTVFTTRPDTLFGVTHMVVAPEHPLLSDLCSEAQAATVKQYVEAAARKSDLERTELQKDKSGVFTGSHAINPATGESVPIWVADYVLGGYGSGAIMAVPGHDTRDNEFAVRFGIPVKQVVEPTAAGTSSSAEEMKLPFTDLGVAVNSSNATTGLDLNGLSSEAAKDKVIQWLQSKGLGNSRKNYKLRDWLFARQRYWGEPFPLVYPIIDSATGQLGAPVALPESELPLLLPETDDFKPKGTPESPLAVIDSWVNCVDPVSGGPARRETSTMPQWAGSCWYYLRFIDPTNNGRLIDPEKEKYWMPVDLYVGGAEHAVLHLLYARFWHKVLYDLGVVSTKEPFGRLVSQGMILGEVEYTVYRDEDGRVVSEEEAGAVPHQVSVQDVERRGDGYFLKAEPSVRVSARAHKMSKSRGNVINPDDVVYQFGADSLRLYEMFMGPLRDTKVWSTRGVEGVHRFLARAYRVFEPGMCEDEPTKDQLRLLHITIKKVTTEIEEMRFNTGISAMMEFINGVTKDWPNRPRAALEPFLLLLAPYAPHLAEELWSRGGHSGSLTYKPWPQCDESLLVSDTLVLPVQVNGKVRGTVEVSVNIQQQEAVTTALANANVAKFTDGKTIKKVIFVNGKILNLIVA